MVMAKRSDVRVLALLSVIAAACQSGALAQPADDPIGPIRCYIVADGKQLAGDSAIELCSGALSDAPGQCFAGALDQFHGLSSQQAQELCRGATSLEPLNCYAGLDATHQLTEGQMIEYCATHCGLGPAPAQVSSPACFDIAINRAGLSLQMAGELCLASRSAGPAYCFLDGQNLHGVASSKLVTLCAESRRCQSYNAVATP
jgi:hypothetical protein